MKRESRKTEEKAERKKGEKTKKAERKRIRAAEKEYEKKQRQKNMPERKPFRYQKQLKAAGIAAFSVLLSVGLGTAFTDTESQWYLGLVKSPLQPPNWVFPIVWTTIYALIGISFYRVLRKDGFAGRAVYAQLLNLALLALWPYVFFYQKLPSMAMILLVINFAVAVYATAAAFHRDNLAGWLLLAELLWLGYAAVLNYTIAMLNEL